MNPWLAVTLVGVGGGVGSICRYLLSLAIGRRLGPMFPFGTFFVNITGSFLLGFLVAFLAQRLSPWNEHLRLLVAVGFLGGYTTFSTYEFESSALLQSGQMLFAILNLFGSLAAGLVAVRLGIAAAKLLG